MRLGGLAAWTATGHPAESGDPAATAATFTPHWRPELLATLDEVRELSTAGDVYDGSLSEWTADPALPVETG
ncbi:hypothetical protein WIS52_17660 [Pseudonocardia nematodicida]|uniref:Uncharacterized protein n=1 Tax=Pseudonocardia nematodicida TaxID=1206997 RepID=A0ABV1KG53_9PSEU